MYSCRGRERGRCPTDSEKSNNIEPNCIVLFRPGLIRAVARRIDPADVVQDVMVAASHQVDLWLEKGEPVFVCLYRLARDRIFEIHRDHIYRQKRTVNKEEQPLEYSDESVLNLASRIVSPGTSPSRAVLRMERRDQVRAALKLLAERDREILMMRIVEGLSSGEVGEVLGISAAAVDMRQLRALRRIRPLLSRLEGSASP